MQEIQDKFVIKVKELPEQVDSSSYSKIIIFKISEIIHLTKLIKSNHTKILDKRIIK